MAQKLTAGAVFTPTIEDQETSGVTQELWQALEMPSGAPPTPPSETSLQDDLQRVSTETDFSGVAIVERNGERLAEIVAGYADRANQRPNRIDTQFATASATKGFTALTVASLIESGALTLDTPLAELTGDALPLADSAVTIEQLLSHTSGVGDYIDEDAGGDIDDYVLGASAHTFTGPSDYLPLLNRHPQVSAPGETFRYNNSGYMMLALAIERASGENYHSQVQSRVLEPAGLAATEFLRSDELPANCALGYLQNGRTNIFNLPVIGTGDGGAYTTAADFSQFWHALFEGRIVSRSMAEQMTTPRQTTKGEATPYGLGFWLANESIVSLVGMDAGVSFHSGRRRADGLTYTILSNTSSGVWPLVSVLDDSLVS
ncbi:MAG: serine hydrolase domain-containing protein [Acidimicrobiales bacterium]